MRRHGRPEQHKIGGVRGCVPLCVGAPKEHPPRGHPGKGTYIRTFQREYQYWHHVCRCECLRSRSHMSRRTVTIGGGGGGQDPPRGGRRALAAPEGHRLRMDLQQDPFEDKFRSGFHKRCVRSLGLSASSNTLARHHVLKRVPNILVRTTRIGRNGEGGEGGGGRPLGLCRHETHFLRILQTC